MLHILFCADNEPDNEPDGFVPGGGQGSVCTAYTALSAALK